ncbi:hypothetical protein J0W85_03600 [Clostridioides difficile]|nr:hypothetical protein [Clostridioides difficile]MCJ0435841.1 hypothetical protein [Clostridioides difficile]
MQNNLLNDVCSEDKECFIPRLKNIQEDKENFYVFKQIVDIYCKQAKYK